jgi:DNA-binding MarR family transcriptional regulator
MSLRPEVSEGFLLWRATLRWQREVAAALAPWSITHVQFVLLASTWWMATHGDPPSQIALARHAATDVKMTSEVVRTLERKGLLLRDVDPSDSRARRLRPTDDGSVVAVATIAAVEAVDRAFFDTLPAERRPHVIPILAALAGMEG